MDFDPINARLTATADEFDDLVRTVADRSSADPPSADRRSAEHVSPQIATMVGLVVDPLRSILVERLDGDRSRPLHVGFDGCGRVTLTERDDVGAISISATHLSLLPALLLHALRIHPGLDVSDDRAEVTTGEAQVPATIDRLAGSTGPLSTWRATGAWRDSDLDAELRVLTTARRGVWEFERTRETDRVTLRPITVSRLAARLGDVVTGRTAREAVG